MHYTLGYEPSDLRFPNRSPGIDYAHPASPGLVLSATCTGTNVMQPIYPTWAQVSSSGTFPSFKTNTLGPTAGWGASANASRQVLTVGTLGAVPYTIAFILFYQTSTGGQAIISTATTTTNHQVIQFTSAGVMTLLMGGTASGSTNFTASANVPYFVAVSASSAGAWNIVVSRLDTGRIVVSGTATNTGASAAGTTINLGNSAVASPIAGLVGGLAAVMVSNVALKLAPLLTWAADPWAFWYPRDNFNLIMDLGPVAVVPDVLMPQIWL